MSNSYWEIKIPPKTLQAIRTSIYEYGLQASEDEIEKLNHLLMLLDPKRSEEHPLGWYVNNRFHLDRISEGDLFIIGGALLVVWTGHGKQEAVIRRIRKKITERLAMSPLQKLAEAAD